MFIRQSKQIGSESAGRYLKGDGGLQRRCERDLWSTDGWGGRWMNLVERRDWMEMVDADLDVMAGLREGGRGRTEKLFKFLKLFQSR